MFQVAGPRGRLNYSSPLYYISSRTVLQSGYFRRVGRLQWGQAMTKKDWLSARKSGFRRAGQPTPPRLSPSIFGGEGWGVVIVTGRGWNSAEVLNRIKRITLRKRMKDFPFQSC